MRAVNGKGNGIASNAVSEPTLPLAPATFSAAGGYEKATLTWSKDTGDATVTGWEYAYKSTGNYGAWTEVPNSSGSTTSYEVTGLTNSVTYAFKLRAVNSAGGGAASPEKTAATAPAKPAIQVVTPGFEKVRILWANPAGTVTGNAYRYKPKSGDDSDYTDWADISGGARTSHEVTGLTNGVRYTFQVRARNAAGGGTPSDEASARTYPAAPANLTTTPGNKLVSLTWDDPNNSSITRYEYQQKTGGSWGNTWTSMTGSDASTTQHVVKGLTNGTEYTFRIRAFSAGGGSPSAEVKATPQPTPVAPTNVSASATRASSATVTWSYANTALIAKFQVRYRAGSGSWGHWADVAKSLTTYTVSSDLTYGTVYTFQVQAVNNQSAAGPSGQDTAATAPSAPEGLAASPALRQVTLGWDDPGYSSITSWQFRRAESKGGLTAFGGNGEVDLFWNSPSDTTGIAKWQYRYKSGGGNYPVTWTDVSGSDASTTSVTVGSLTNATAYTFQVRAVNASDALVGTVLGDPTATPTTGAGWTDISNSGATTTSHTVTNLATNTDYAFQVRAVNPAGNGLASAPVTTTTTQEPSPGKPTNLAATPGDEKVSLSWTNPTGPLTGNSYRYKAAGGGYTEWTDIGSVATSRDVTGLTNGVHYTFQVRASNQTGDGAIAQASAWTYPAAPANLTATPGDKVVSLSWDDPNNSSITRYEYQRKTGGNWGSTWTRIDRTATLPPRSTLSAPWLTERPTPSGCGR